MSERVWDTARVCDPGFEREWYARLARIPHAHFAMRLDWLAWGARHGTPARAALVEDGEREGLVILRHEHGEWVSGWPWRWQLMALPHAACDAMGLCAADFDWLLDEASRLSGTQRVRAFVPVVNGSRRGFPGGRTLLLSLAPDEERLLASMGADKRRTVKKCEKSGYTVVEAETHEQFRAYRRLQYETAQRRRRDGHGDGDGAASFEADPAPGEAWREWELPWQWLLLAIRDGSVHAGSGFGRIAGGTLDYRTNASTTEGMRAGANVLLAWEALRRGRAAGMQWMNWGGATIFKRQLGGELVGVECRLGGHAFWSIPNRVETSVHRTRPQLTQLLKTARESARPRRPQPIQGSLLTWSTREPASAEFGKQWLARIARAPLVNFSLRLDHLQFEAGQGRHALVVLAEGDGRRGALVLRERGRELHCGWPWRWQAVLEGSDAGHEPGMDDGDAAWLFARAHAAAGGRRLRCYLPCEPMASAHGFLAGNTIVQNIAHSDEELFAGMNANKRRMLRRAQKTGFEIAPAGGVEDWQAFAEVQRIAARARGEEPAPPPESPPPGLGFREWELPWMWLQVARRDGRIVAGLGDGIAPRGVIEGRAAAAVPEARREGVMSLLCHFEARALRDAGHRWLNHGGDTVFKREVSGTLGSRLSMWCWLGGGRAWGVPNRTESWALRARPRLAAWARAWRSRRAKKGKQA